VTFVSPKGQVESTRTPAARERMTARERGRIEARLKSSLPSRRGAAGMP
jgi:hypothetical protein